MNTQLKLSTLTTLIIGALLILLGPASVRAQGQSLALTDQDNGKTIELKQGDVIELSLPGNASTGYTWGVTGVDSNVLKQVGDWDYNVSSDMPGAPGTFVFKFEAVGAGSTDLALGYKRWWDRAAKVEKTFEISVSVAATPREPQMKLTNADNGKVVTAHTGDRLALTLDCNPSTGYSWQVMELNTAVLKQVGDPSFQSSSSAIGAGGTCTFAFDAIATGASALKLGYKQWWDETMQPNPVFAATVIVNVQPAPAAAPNSAQGAPSSVNLTDKDSGQTVSLAQGGTLTISLPGNATTGYTWGLVSNEASVLQPAGDWDYHVQSSAEGAPGTFIWTFDAANTGVSKVVLAYKRWWDDASQPEKTFEVTVSVESPITEDMPLLLGAPIQLDEGDNGTTLAVERGQIITVTLNCNRTTGSAWRIMRNNDSVLEHLGGGPRNTGSMPGQGSVCVHSFRALRDGSSDLKMGYKQWFDTNARPERTFQIHVDVGLLQ